MRLGTSRRPDSITMHSGLSCGIVPIVADASTWVEKWSQRVLSWFSQREVKTPLAFYFRLIGAVVVIVLAGLYFALPEQRFRIFFIGILALAVLAGIVALFTCFNVKNLVYGESGHRAEMKFKYGTDKKEIGLGELVAMPGTENPRALPDAQNPNAIPDEGGAQ